MTMVKKNEYGDFQTPEVLADEVAGFLTAMGLKPAVILEPTCGVGSFVMAGIKAFPAARQVVAFDVNADYVSLLQQELRIREQTRLQVECRDFFQVDWPSLFLPMMEPILVIGNPPWVTNAAMGSLKGSNLPAKSNFQRHVGFSAKTGKSNFDISEWMLIRLVETLSKKEACIAMLCKTSVARKVLRHAWKNQAAIARCSLHLIDAKKHFGVSVDACLLVVCTGKAEATPSASVYGDLSFNNRLSTIGLLGGELVADFARYQGVADIDGCSHYKWRSGVKHDASDVMEFTRCGEWLVNGLGERCLFEPDYLYPLLKSSDIANGRLSPQRYVLVTQRRPAQPTEEISTVAPKTWQYLLVHAGALDKRKSLIYEKRAQFSIFGVGDYTFAPWKVAISGLYKNSRFEVIGTLNGKPIVVDDTCYFIPCKTEEEARFACQLLNGVECQQLLRSLVFFDAKRPITIDVLNRLDLNRLANRLNRKTEAKQFLYAAAGYEDRQPLLVFDGHEPASSGLMALKDVPSQRDHKVIKRAARKRATKPQAGS